MQESAKKGESMKPKAASPSLFKGFTDEATDDRSKVSYPAGYLNSKAVYHSQ